MSNPSTNPSNAASPCIVEIFGEGTTELGEEENVILNPVNGIVPILVRRICNDPIKMRVKCKRFSAMQGRGSISKKIQFSIQQARYNKSSGCVFVKDSDGDSKAIQTELKKGITLEGSGFPAAIGIPHPCVEAWILASPASIRKTLNKNVVDDFEFPKDPESLSHIKDDPNHPKTVICNCNKQKRHPNVAEKCQIIEQASFESLVKCPSFQAFATEVRTHIAPLFHIPTVENPAVEETS